MALALCVLTIRVELFARGSDTARMESIGSTDIRSNEAKLSKSPNDGGSG
jgi:hypothetical protein